MLYTFLMMVIWSYFPVLNHVLYGDDRILCFSYDTINEQKCETVVKKQCRTVQEEVTIITFVNVIIINNNYTHMCVIVVTINVIKES